MSQASNRRQEEAKEGWVKAGARASTQQRSEGINVPHGKRSLLVASATSNVGASSLVSTALSGAFYHLDDYRNLREFSYVTLSLIVFSSWIRLLAIADPLLPRFPLFFLTCSI